MVVTGLDSLCTFLLSLLGGAAAAARRDGGKCGGDTQLTGLRRRKRSEFRAASGSWKLDRCCCLLLLPAVCVRARAIVTAEAAVLRCAAPAPSSLQPQHGRQRERARAHRSKNSIKSVTMRVFLTRVMCQTKKPAHPDTCAQLVWFCNVCTRVSALERRKPHTRNWQSQQQPQAPPIAANSRSTSTPCTLTLANAAPTTTFASLSRARPAHSERSTHTWPHSASMAA